MEQAAGVIMTDLIFNVTFRVIASAALASIIMVVPILLQIAKQLSSQPSENFSCKKILVSWVVIFILSVICLVFG